MKSLSVPVTTTKLMYGCDLCTYTSEYASSVRDHEREAHQTAEHLSFDLLSNGYPVEFWKFATEDQFQLAMKGRWAPNAKWSGPGWYFWREKGDRYVDYGPIKDLYDLLNGEAQEALEKIDAMEYRLKLTPDHRKYVPAEHFRKAQKLLVAQQRGALDNEQAEELLELISIPMGEEE